MTRGHHLWMIRMVNLILMIRILIDHHLLKIGWMEILMGLLVETHHFQVGIMAVADISIEYLLLLVIRQMIISMAALATQISIGYPHQAIGVMQISIVQILINRHIIETRQRETSIARFQTIQYFQIEVLIMEVSMGLHFFLMISIDQVTATMDQTNLVEKEN